MRKITRNPYVYCKKLDGLWYLLKEKERYVYELNEVASTLWDQLEKEITEEALIGIIAKNYVIETSSISFDIRFFLKTLIKENYIRVLR